MSGGANASGGPSAGGNNNPGPNATPGPPGSTGSDLEQHLHHMSVTPGPGGNPDSASSTPVSQSGKSAFIELQHNNLYNPGGLRTGGYQGHNVPGAHQFSQHLGGHQPGGQPASQQHESGFPSPRSALAGYPFAPMHQHNAYGYHLGSYAPQCPSPPKDGEYPNCKYICILFRR